MITQTNEGSTASEKILNQNRKPNERERFVTAPVITKTERRENLNKRPNYIDKTE